MKVFKKLSMLFVAAAMMMTTVSTAFAAEATEGEGFITIDRENASYEAFKVLDSKTKTVGGKQIEVYTVNKDFEEFFKGPYTFVPDEGIMKDGTLVKPVDSLLSGDSKSYQQDQSMKELTKALYDYANKEKCITFEGSKQKGLNQGYYLIVENSTTISGNENTGRVPSLAMLVKIKQGQTFTIHPKDSELTINKTVNGSDSNVGGVGVEQTFKITSTVPTYGPNYKNITYIVKDTMSKGLTLKKNSIVVTVGGTVVDDDVVKTTFANGANGETITTFTFDYEKIRSDSELGQAVEITYTAVINENAVVYNPNTNEAELIYTTTPDDKHNGIKDTTDTYTYGLKIVKRNAANTETVLPGATFEIKNEKSEKVGEFTTDKNGVGSFTGLAEGIYTLEETVAPDGYAKLDGKITIEIKANEDKKDCSMKLVDVDEDVAYDVNVVNGVIQFSVNNFKGINLPETGGMGTTIFMIGGATLITLAGAMLFIYSKKSKKA